MTNNGGMTLRALETLLGVDSTDLAKHLTPMVRGKYKYVCSMLVVSLMVVLVQHRSLDTLDLLDTLNLFLVGIQWRVGSRLTLFSM